MSTHWENHDGGGAEEGKKYQCLGSGRLRWCLSYLATLFIVALICSCAWTLLWTLPKPLNPSADASVFSEGRAWAHLLALQDIGPSLVGTRSNVDVALYIEARLLELATEMSRVRSLPHQPERAFTPPLLEVEIQRPSGALNFDLVGNVLTNAYTRLHNVVVRLSWPNSTQSMSSNVNDTHTIDLDQMKALLVNSHFDSGLSSPGAMDARTCISIMLELVRSLCYSHVPLQHPVVFLFNGAEESLQEGSHGFITQHRWRKQIASVLNMDAGGLGGPEILFQVGSGEYAEAFVRSAPRPHGSITAQELFDTGLLQGDTDYRIFRDHGDVHGIDLAFFKDGYKYHTPLDDVAYLEEGSMQHCGDNTLAYIKAVCNSDILENKPSRQQVVFYDIVHLYMFIYSRAMGRILHTIAVGLASIIIWKFSKIAGRDLLWSTLSVFGSNVAAYICAAIVATVMTLIGKVMSWFGTQMVIVYLYTPPLVLGWLLVQRYMATSPRGRNKPWQVLEYELFHGLLAWSASTLLVWSLGIYSSYFFLWLTSSGILACIIVQLFKPTLKTALENQESLVPWYAYLAYVPTIVLNAHVLFEVMALAFPLSGRLPPDVPVELVTASIFCIVYLQLIIPCLPLIHRFRHYQLTIRVVVVLVLVGMVIGSATWPYTPYRPKRVTIQHAYRTAPFEGHPTLDDPAVLFALCDAGPVGNLVDNLKELDTRGASPHRDVHDWDAVFPFSTFLSGYALPSPHPHLRAPVGTILKDNWNATTMERSLVIQIDYEGSEWSTLKFKGPLKRWNLTEEIPPTSIGGYHVVRHIGEHQLTKWAVEVVFPDQNPRRLDFTVAHFTKTPFVVDVMAQLPDWVAPFGFTSAMSHITI